MSRTVDGVRLRFLLRPGWLTLTLVVFAFAVSCFTLLAPWQFGEHEERKAENAALRGAQDAPPRPLEELLPGGKAPDTATQWSRVRITGEYLREDEVVARLRHVQGSPASDVLTPLRTTGGEIVLVDRGFVRLDERSRLPDYAAAPSGEVTLLTRARIDESRSDPAVRVGGRVQVYGVGSAIAGEATGLDIRPGYFQLEGDQPGSLEPEPLPQIESGPFLSYAMQWIAFGVMALLGWFYFTWRELKPGGVLHEQGEKQRRKSVAEQLAEDEQQVTPLSPPTLRA